MFELIIEFEDGRIEKSYFSTKEEVEREVDFFWTPDAEISVKRIDSPFSVFWEDRFDFGW